jgi:putative addiction module component (TIGR02574 family)
MNGHLLNDALQLSANDRLELIEKLWDSLAHTNLPVTEAEKQFLDQRIADMDASPDAQSSWQDARARLIKRTP